ncbi:unnamed protein product [Darwinula stevensoni]|uniref:CUB domain-containing protein n=1 Tax=Darwinula stevensoni TaxID=69355 RepID=A0A7R8WYB3_9CRUS|nr:unnamed protein product [Darwinula stevensoni]CAG0879144.1 unnamed protein product [Darwinula stevensoni]
MLGGGAVADRGGEGNMLVGLVPSCDGSSFFGKATDLKLPDPKKLTVYAIQCKNVVFGSYPSCGTQSWLSLGQSSLIMSENFPNNYPSLHFCRWSFACSQDMTLQCSHFQLPSSLLCWQSDFIYNNRRSCGSSTELKSPVNVGKDLSVAFYSIGASGPGFKCKVTCDLRGPVAPNGWISELKNANYKPQDEITKYDGNLSLVIELRNEFSRSFKERLPQKLLRDETLQNEAEYSMRQTKFQCL